MLHYGDSIQSLWKVAHESIENIRGYTVDGRRSGGIIKNLYILFVYIYDTPTDLPGRHSVEIMTEFLETFWM